MMIFRENIFFSSIFNEREKRKKLTSVNEDFSYVFYKGEILPDFSMRGHLLICKMDEFLEVLKPRQNIYPSHEFK